jgi:hypothetical protein
MRRHRHLPWVAVVWLSCQAATFAIAPFACCDHDHAHGASRADSHDCPHGGGRADMCPLHRGSRHGSHGTTAAGQHPAAHSHHDPDHGTGHHHNAASSRSADPSAPTMHCSCRVSDVALGAILIGNGVLPPAFVLPYEPAFTRVLALDDDAAAHAPLPDTPPPRN